MIRTQIQLTEEQSQGLRKLAAKNGESVAELIRQAVDQKLAGDAHSLTEEKRKRALSVVGCVSSGVGDLSTRHDDYLLEAFAE
jgi:Ribbon-helix-helix protein, copG family.